VTAYSDICLACYMLSPIHPSVRTGDSL